MKYRYRKEEEMKDSGVHWIGKIPSDWECINFSRSVSLKQGLQIAQDERFYESGEGRYVYITVKYINSDRNDTDTEYILNPSKGVMCSKDEILLARTGATGKVVTNIEGVFHNNFFKVIYDNRKLRKNYLVYYLTQNSVQEHLKLIAGTTTIPDLNHGDFLSTKHLIPQIYEQEKIIKFLDKKTAQFDSIISKKEALIKRLEEAKKSLISEVVTGKVKVVKTDDGYELVERKKEEMKDSGVEWLGYIPREWNISKVKHKCDINSSVLSENTDEDYSIKYIDIGSVSSNGSIENIQQLKFKDAPSRARRILKDNDILVSTVRTYLRAITSIENVEEGLICSTGFTVLSPRKNVNFKYLSYFIRSNLFIDEIVSRSTGVSYPAITSTAIGNLEIVLPKEDEQLLIGEFLNRRVNKVNKITYEVKKQINKLNEAKQSLISEAVTGKIEILD